jgi:hypothetical protein
MLEKHPGLQYIYDKNMFVGVFSFRAQYCEGPVISDHFTIAILCNFPTNSPLPAVCDLDGRIKRMALLLGVPTADLHLNGDDTLCLIRPDKFKIWYPDGFDIRIFEQNLVTHFYWLSFRERYGKEPWKGEEHGGFFNFD